MSLTIEIRKEGRTAVLCLAGSLTVNNAKLARESILEKKKKGTDSFCFDLSALDRIESAGLGELIRIYSSSHNEGIRARLSGTTSRVRELLQLARLQNAFNSDPPVPASYLNRNAWIRKFLLWVTLLLTAAFIFLAVEPAGYAFHMRSAGYRCRSTL